jgi:hypothetical protein
LCLWVQAGIGFAAASTDDGMAPKPPCRFQADEIYTVRTIVHPILQAEWDLRWGNLVCLRAFGVSSTTQAASWLPPQVPGAQEEAGSGGSRDHEERECMKQNKWQDLQPAALQTQQPATAQQMPHRRQSCQAGHWQCVALDAGQDSLQMASWV